VQWEQAIEGCFDDSQGYFTPGYYVFYLKDGGCHDLEAVQECLWAQARCGTRIAAWLCRAVGLLRRKALPQHEVHEALAEQFGRRFRRTHQSLTG
jgi:hypothetical protein